jgi:hypothetical protein
VERRAEKEEEEVEEEDEGEAGERADWCQNRPGIIWIDAGEKFGPQRNNVGLC